MPSQFELQACLLGNSTLIREDNQDKPSQKVTESRV